MDRARFTSRSPGRLVQIDLPRHVATESPRKDWSFIPDELPTKWEFDQSLWPILADAKESLGTLNGIGQTLSDPGLLLRPLQSREALASSRIEGTYATPEQLLLYELDPREPKNASEDMASWQEVANYNQALRHGCELLKTLPVCNRVMKEIHEKLLRGVRGRQKGPGTFRKWQVQIGSTGRFIPPPANEVDRLMGNLEKYVNSEDRRYDPLVRAYLVHYQLEAIHPFGDGNGRVGRLGLALMLQGWLKHSHPWLYMSPYFERFKDEYMQNLFNISTQGAWREWIEFCLRGTIEQANDSIRRCREFNRLYGEFHERAKPPTPRTHAIIEILFEHPVVSVALIEQRCQIRYNTARRDLDQLVNFGIVREIAGSRPRTYYCPELMAVVYREDWGVTEPSSDSAFPEPPSEQSPSVSYP